MNVIIARAALRLAQAGVRAMLIMAGLIKAGLRSPELGGSGPGRIGDVR